MNEEAMQDDELLQEMLAEFLAESDEILSSLNENVLELDAWARTLSEGEQARCDDDLLNQMFRDAHTLKGLSGMLGLSEVNALTHKVENLFDAARSDRLTLTSGVVDLVFRSIDLLSNQVENLTDVHADPVDCKVVLEEMERVLGGEELSGQVVEAGVAPDVPEVEAADPVTEVIAQDTAQPSAIQETVAETEAESGSDDPFASISDEAEISSKYLAIFIDEAGAALDDVTETLSAENAPASTESLLIQCHKVKGSAASIGLNRAAQVAHIMEDVLQELSDKNNDLTPGISEALLRSADVLRNYVDSLGAGEPQTHEFSDVYQTLQQARLGEGNNTDDAVVVSPAELTAAQEEELKAAAPVGQEHTVVQVQFEAGLELAGLKASLVYQRLSQVADIFFCHPSDEELEVLAEVQCLTLGIVTEEKHETIESRIQVEGVEKMEFQRQQPVAEEPAPAVTETVEEKTPAVPVPAKENAPKAAAPPKKRSGDKPAGADSGAKPTETLRVDIERLDQLMNLAGELVINKARFSQIEEGLKGVTSSRHAANALTSVFTRLDSLSREVDSADPSRDRQQDLDLFRSHARKIRVELEQVQSEIAQFRRAGTWLNDLADTVHQLDRVTDEIQKTVMDTRMVPIGPLFRRFKRVVRDIAHRNEKDIRLVINGENTELDKRMIDELGDPLIHMVRNCADHGIELPDVRQAAGKPRQGTVKLDAYHRGNSILVEITDDGKGLDPDRIRDKAIEKGIISVAEAEKMTPHQIYQLIWEPGLSTAEKVTEVSGRGMGMDIVRSRIEDLNGTIELDSTVGQGTTITVKLPLTLAILPSLLVEIEGDVIAMPVEAVSEIVVLKSEDLASVHGMLTANVRGRVVSVIQLDHLFSWNQPPRDQADNATDEQSLVIINLDGRELGLVADRLLGEQDIVIKSMAENYRNVDGIAGASILGDGRVSLILDVGAVLEMSTHANHSMPIEKECSQ